MRRRESVALCLLALGLVSGCASRTSKVAVRGDLHLEHSGLRPDDYPSQRIFRVRYQGPRDQGSFRIVLRLASGDRYQLKAVDPVGRGLWALDYDRPDLLFINYRTASACRARGSLVISAVSLDVLPVGDLPALLLGRLPATASSGGLTENGTLVDARGREWRVVEASDEVTTWTMLEAGAPFLWFRRLEDGYILSHRLGEQFRWRETLREPLDGELVPLVSPAGVTLSECEEMSGR